MRIVYFIDHLRPDGSQFVLKQLVGGLGARGHEQTVICLNDSWDPLLLRQLQERGAEVVIVGKAALLSGLGVLALFRRLRRSRFDVAVTLLFASDVLGRTLARLAGVPRIVSSIQTRDEFYRPWQRFLVRCTMRWADVVHLCSANIRDFAVREEGVPPDRIRVIPHSVLPERYTNPMERGELRAEFGLTTDQLLLGSVGRLTRQKGFDVLLAALSLLPRKDAHLLVAGVGEEEGRLRRQAEELGLEGRVHFAGYRRDVPRLLGALDLYVQASRYEGMSIAVLEAMASGCPVVVTAVDGNCELIKDGQHGWLVPPEDPRSLAEAIATALDQPDEAICRAKSAKLRVANHFAENVMVASWEKMMAAKHL